MKKKVLFVYAAAVFVLPLILSCALEGRLDNNITIDNPGVTTNYTTNQFTPEGSFLANNVQNEDIVQPVFTISGILEGDYANLMPDGFGSITFEVTNTGYTGVGKVWESSGVKYWQAVLFGQTNYDYIFVRLTAQLGTSGSSTLCLNFNISNIPAYVYDSDYDGLVTNVTTIDLAGNSSLASPQTIKKVYLYQITASGTTNTTIGSYSGVHGTGWTNGVTNCRWIYDNVALSSGANYFYGYAVSSAYVSNALEPFTITRALIGVDGVKETTWNTAFAAGNSPTAGLDGYRLGQLLITNDSDNIYFWVDAANVPDSGTAGNGCRISIAIDTNTPGGMTNDAWGATYVYDMTNGNSPDFQFEFRIQDGGGQALYFATKTNTVTFWSNVANNWSGSMNGVQMAVVRTSGFEIGAPLSLLGLAAGTPVRAIVVLSGLMGDNGDKQAWDVIPESPSNDISVDDNDFDDTERVWCQTYPVH